MLSAVCVCLNERPQPRQDHQIGYSRNGNHGARYSHRIVSSTLSHITFSFPSALILYLLYIPAPMPPFPHHTHTFSHISRTRLFSQLYRFFAQLSMLSPVHHRSFQTPKSYEAYEDEERESCSCVRVHTTHTHTWHHLSRKDEKPSLNCEESKEHWGGRENISARTTMPWLIRTQVKTKRVLCVGKLKPYTLHYSAFIQLFSSASYNPPTLMHPFLGISGWNIARSKTADILLMRVLNLNAFLERKSTLFCLSYVSILYTSYYRLENTIHCKLTWVYV